MDKIRSVKELPDWFRNRKYRKNLSEIDWYREVRKRQYLAGALEFCSRDGQGLATRRSYGDMLALEMHPQSPLLLIAQHDSPVRDLQANEIAFLRFLLKSEPVEPLLQEYEGLLRDWVDTAGSGFTPSFYDYERNLEAFFRRLEEDGLSRPFDAPCENGIGNPWLSYGRPMGGHPVIIDTQFDDDTILRTVKAWLNAKRKIDGVTARRPFNQNDFDDWEYYRIRELFDLETWASANDVKILDKVIVAALWPNAGDDISPIDILRTTARKKAGEVFRMETAVRFFGQLLIAHGENFLAT